MSTQLTTETRTDADLVRAAQAGDTAALGLVLERHRALLLGVAMQLVGYGPAAEDAVHEAFLVALRRLDTLREPAAVAGWLRSIVRNACLMHLRGAARQVPTTAVPVTGTGVVPSAEDQVERLVLRDWTRQALESLSEPLRLVVLLRFFTSYCSYEQIAAVCDVPVGTVRSRLNAAKRKLADELLQQASGTGTDLLRDAEQRAAALDAAMDDINRHQDVAAFVDLCDPDVSFRAGGAEVHGHQGVVEGIGEDLSAGVTYPLTNIVASREVTIAEGRFVNPSSDPDHCPPLAAQIHLHPDGGRSRRILMHYADGWPAVAEPTPPPAAAP